MPREKVPPHLLCCHCKQPSGGLVLCQKCLEATMPFRLAEPPQPHWRDRRRKPGPRGGE